MNDEAGDLALYAGLAEMRAGRYDESEVKLNVALRSNSSPLMKAVTMRAASVRSALAGQNDRRQGAERAATLHLKKMAPLKEVDPNWTMLLMSDLLKMEAKVAFMKVTGPMAPISDRPEHLPEKLHRHPTG